MLLIRAVPLSLRILCRMIPIALILVILFAVAGVILWALSFGALMVLGPSVTPLASLAFGVFGAGFGVLWIMTAIRQGFAAVGIEPRNGHGALALAAIGYGTLYAVLTGLLVFGIEMVANNPLLISAPKGLTGLLSGPSLNGVVRFADPDGLTGPLIAGFALLAAVRAAMLVPMASASVGFDPSGRTHTPLVHAGRRLAPLYVAVLVAFVLGWGVLPALGETLPQILPEEDREALLRTNGTWEALSHYNWQPVVIFCLSALWCTCYEAAAAVLAHREMAAVEAAQATAHRPTGPQVSSVDLRALREERARMQDQPG